MIPKKIRKRLQDDPYMQTCVHCNTTHDITWEHPWTYNGKQINEVWSIVPLCRACHQGNNGTLKPGAKDSARRASLERLLHFKFENFQKYNKPMDKTWSNRTNYYLK